MSDDRQRHLEILHELAMSIGGSVDMASMLGASMPVFLRLLDATSISVVAIDDDGGARSVFALPRRTRPGTLAGLIERARVGADGVVEDERGVLHTFDLPGFGMLVIGRSAPLPEALRHELVALAAKLASALRACRQWEDLQRAQASLAESEERWMFAIEASGDGVWEWTPATNETAYSERWLRMLGFADGGGPADGSAWMERVHPDDLPALLQVMQEHLDGARPSFACEYRFRCGDGAYRWVLGRGKLLARRASGMPERVIGTLTDVSDRRAQAAELERHRHHLQALVEERTAALSIAKEAAEAANRAKTAFLANMSHELRTPLNGVMGMTALAKRHAEDPQLRQYLEKVDRSSRALLTIINDVLDVARVEADRLELHPVAFTLDELLSHQRTLFGQLAAGRGLELSIPPLGPVGERPFEGDATRLGQVLANLVGNALKFTERGRVELRASVASADAAGTLLSFEVEDTGIGIAPSDHARIFAPFEQVDASLSRRFGGTGLGLGISRTLARMMGGDIQVRSALGQGSRFTFTARVKQAAGAGADHEARGHALEEQLRAKHRGRHVLFVEDDPVALVIGEELLAMAGLEVTAIEDGASALREAKARRFDAIVLDVHLPFVDGLEIARTLRADSPNADTPILALTASAFEADVRACLAAGMNAHLSKPIEPAPLYARLTELLEAGRA
jgi:two-component system sensor histidine kinase/response regulator